MKTVLGARHVLAVVPVSDFRAALRWYERLFDAPPTNVPMDGLLAEWRVTESGWAQVSVDAGRAGRGLLNFATGDLEALRTSLVARGLDPEEIVEANKNVRLCGIEDPDGNRITFIGGFREDY